MSRKQEKVGNYKNQKTEEKRKYIKCRKLDVTSEKVEYRKKQEIRKRRKSGKIGNRKWQEIRNSSKSKKGNKKIVKLDNQEIKQKI